MSGRKINPESSIGPARTTRAAGKGVAGFIRLSLVASLFALAPSLPVAAAEEGETPSAKSDTRILFDIPRQRADLALIEFAQQADVTYIAPFDEAQRTMANRLAGRYTRDEAIRLLLQGTGLQPEFDARGALAVRSARTNNLAGDAMQNSGRRTWAGLAAAALSFFIGRNASGQQAPDAPPEGGSGPARVEEVVVTAQKRVERLQDVPVPVSVVDTEALASNGQVLLREYASSVPGLSVQPDIVSQQEVSIRGITTGGSGVPTVSIVVDDVPYGGSTNFSGGNYLPDIDPGELERIEVLRGPQGALYGANSMGGLVKFVTTDPSTSGYDGRLQIGASSVSNGDGLGYNARGAFNIPLSSTWALRASAYTRQDPGYIDNPALGIDGINESTAYGGRLSALWQPSEDFSLKLGAVYQHIKWDGASEVESEPGLGEWQQTYIPGMGGYNRSAQIYSAVLKAKLGSVDLTSISGYSQNRTHSTLDFGFTFSPTIADLYEGATGAPYNNYDKVTRFTQELRLAGAFSQSLEWMVGTYYSRERDPNLQVIEGQDLTTLAIVGPLFRFEFPNKYEEYAAFANLTWQLTDRIDVQFGGRQSHSEVKAGPQVQSGPLVGGAPVVTPLQVSKATPFTYLLTPRFKVSPDLMVYARFASGFRTGLPNTLAANTPSQSNPDKTLNYEIGLKGDFFDHLLSIDASLYRIDWQNIQLQLINTFQYADNGGDARSQGVELSVETRPLDGLTIGAWAVYSDAELTEDMPAASTAQGSAGDRLPISSRFSANLSLRQEFPLWQGANGFISGSVSYVGDRLGSFTATGQARQALPSYTKADLSAGFDFNNWSANLFINNVTDERGLLGGGVGYLPPTAFIYTMPRTVGVSLINRF